MYIFYDNKTLKIMGGGTDDKALKYPSVWTDTFYHSFENLGIEIVEGEARLKIIKGYMT